MARPSRLHQAAFVAHLKKLTDPDPDPRVELRGDRTVFGRHPTCEIQLDNAAVSRQHAQIVRRHGNYFLEDLRSRNRTYLNGIAVDGRTLLNDADEIRICDSSFAFFHRDDEEIDGSSVTDARPPEAMRRTSATSRTLIEEFAKPPTADEMEDSSSIITRMSAKSSSSMMQLGVKPEVKLRAILEISNTLARTLKLEDVLQSLLEGLFKVFPQADDGFVLLTDNAGGKTIVKSAKARGGDSGSVRMSNTIIRQVMQTSEAILSADAVEDSRFNSSESLSELSIRSMLCAPLLGKDGIAIGVIQIATTSLRQQFVQSDLEVIVSVSSQASLAIENARLHEDLVRQSDIDRELRFATQVQLGFLPEKRPQHLGYEFFDYYEAAQRVGGDYFDYIKLNNGRVAVALADVAGKGVPAALLMARLYSSARLHLLTQPTVGKALSAMNAEIYDQGLGHRFVTFVFLVLDPATHELIVANAGHLPPIIRDAAGKVHSIPRKESGMPLGVEVKQEYGEMKMTVEPGMAITVYTDGITEAMNPANDLFGRVRLEQFIAAGPKTAEALVKGIVAEVDRFCGSRPQRDDMCVVALRRSTEVSTYQPPAPGVEASESTVK